MSDIEWQTSRRGLVKLIHERVPDLQKPAESPKPKPGARMGARIKVPDGMTPESLCRLGIKLEKEGQSVEKAAASIGVGISVFRQMRDILMMSDTTYLTRWDKARVEVVIEDMNEHRQVRRNRQSLDDIAERLLCRIRLRD